MHTSTSNADQMPNAADSTELPWQQSTQTKPIHPNQNQDRISSTVELKLHSMNGLMDVLVTISRIGANIDFVSAQANSVVLSVTAKPFIVKRIPSLLRELIEVLNVKAS